MEHGFDRLAPGVEFPLYHPPVTRQPLPTSGVATAVSRGVLVGAAAGFGTAVVAGVVGLLTNDGLGMFGIVVVAAMVGLGLGCAFGAATGAILGAAHREGASILALRVLGVSAAALPAAAGILMLGMPRLAVLALGTAAVGGLKAEWVARGGAAEELEASRFHGGAAEVLDESR